MSDQLVAGMNTAHRLSKIEGVEEIALGSFTTIRYKIKPNDPWQSGWLIMREDYEAQTY